MDLINRYDLLVDIEKNMEEAVEKKNWNDLIFFSKIMCLISKQKSEGEVPIKAKWSLQGGWKSNHDQRIEDATCTNCGYVHKKVYHSLENLSKICPNCGAKIEGYIET